MAIIQAVVANLLSVSKIPMDKLTDTPAVVKGIEIRTPQIGGVSYQSVILRPVWESKSPMNNYDPFLSKLG